MLILEYGERLLKAPFAKGIPRPATLLLKVVAVGSKRDMEEKWFGMSKRLSGRQLPKSQQAGSTGSDRPWEFLSSLGIVRLHNE